MSSSDLPISELMKRAQRDLDAENQLAVYFGNQGIAVATRLMSKRLKDFVDPEDIAGEALRSAISDLSNCRVSPENRKQFFQFLSLKVRQKLTDASRMMTAECRDSSRNSSLDHADVLDFRTLSPDVRAVVEEQAGKIFSAVVSKYIGNPVRPSRLMTATLAAFTGMTPKEIHERVVAATGDDISLSTVSHTVSEVRREIEEWLKRPDDDETTKAS